MTQDEEIISNISYTASDFRTIYPQLLDTAKKLTNKWDPSLSNESDPGNILIKEAAIVGDKVNYHIDKNVLECFPLSATQQSSARQIYDLVGYNMHWYKSAEGEITFRLLKAPNVINSSLTDIPIYAGTIVSDTTGEYVYTLTQPVVLSKTNTIYKTSAIQGTINPYEINGENTITLNHLDENLRLYFPQNMISENGIYVFGDGYNTETNGFSNNETSKYSQAWMLVDNLTKYPAGSKVFKFGLDLNSDNCYIQFPEDVDALIESGLNIYYTTTLGLNGNLKAGIINKFLSDYSVNIEGEESVPVNDYIVVSNNATIGGVDPETLEEAYRNYKKLIGTYDTLVTRRDYENAIYKLNNSTDSNNLISNALVTDRTTDINYSQSVIEPNLYNTYAKNYVIKNGTSPNKVDVMQSYDIVLYLLQAPESMLTVENYNTSFEPDLSGSSKINIETQLDELKAIQHNFYYIPEIVDGSDPDELYFNIKNICKLVGTLTTYYKVTETEAKEIENNVIKALVTNYNARAIDFGNQLDFDDLVSTIKSADDRIRNVSLNTPAYEPNMQFANNASPKSLYSADNENINYKTLAKMVLAGKVQLFSFQSDFQYDFGQVSTQGPFEKLETISTENPIVIPFSTDDTFDDNTAYTLKENDIVQILTPNLVTTETYQATVSYAANFKLDADKVYKLTGTNKIKFIYLDSVTTTKQVKIYSAEKNPGLYIKVIGTSYSQENANTVNSWTTDKWESTDSSIPGTKTLRANESIEISKLSEITINSGTPYYIITDRLSSNKKYYELALTTDDYILKENEYFLYTNSTLDGLVVLGSGTTLRANEPTTLLSEVITLEDALSTDISDATSKWNSIPNGKNIVAAENTIVNLTQGDMIAVDRTDITQFYSYTISGNTITFDVSKTIEKSGTLNTAGSTLTYNNNSYTYSEQDSEYVYTDTTSSLNYYIIVKTNESKLAVINPVVCENSLQDLQSGMTFIYKFSSEDSSKYLSIPANVGSDYKVKYKSNMILSGNAIIPQKLVGTQKVIIPSTPNDIEIVENNCLLYSYPVNLSGGDDINVQVLNETTGEYESLLSIYSYEYKKPTDVATIERENGLLTIKGNDGATNVIKLNFTFNSTNHTQDNNYPIDNYYMIPASFVVPENKSITLSLDNDLKIGSFESIFNQSQSVTNTITIDESGNYVLVIKNATANASNFMEITFSDQSDKLIATFGYIQQIVGLNANEINSENIASNYYKFDIEGNASDSTPVINKVISAIKKQLTDISKDTSNPIQYDWSYIVPSVNKVLQPISGESYFNPNHIYNKCTIAKIDFDNSAIKVSSASIK